MKTCDNNEYYVKYNLLKTILDKMLKMQEFVRSACRCDVHSLHMARHAGVTGSHVVNVNKLLTMHIYTPSVISGDARVKERIFFHLFSCFFVSA